VIALLATAWRRPAITASMLRWHAEHAPRSWLLVVTLSPGDPEPVRLADIPPRWIVAMAPNAPLGEKHNAGLRTAREHGATHGVVCASCNFMSAEYMASVEREMSRGVEHGGVRDAFVCRRSESSGMIGPRAYWPGYGAAWMTPTIIGSGRWFPLVAEWPSDLESGLDAGLTASLVTAGVARPRAYSVRELGPLTLTRGDVQLTANARYGC
jgi:hypothetical protein